MTAYDRLYAETASARNRFLAIPLVRQAAAEGGSRAVYLDFLTQAYHHVKHTFPLLSLAAALTKNERYQGALFEYMKEERGHDKWILDDIRALGGNADKVANSKPDVACETMVGYAYYAIEHISPYAILGMVHVLEGLSIMLAHTVATAVKNSLKTQGNAGFSYLVSHGSLDIEHVTLFKNFVNGFEDADTVDIIIDAARVFYRLYGAIFVDMGHLHTEVPHAA
jgi:hypothetical protein